MKRSKRKWDTVFKAKVAIEALKEQETATNSKRIILNGSDM